MHWSQGEGAKLAKWARGDGGWGKASLSQQEEPSAAAKEEQTTA